MQGEKTEMGKVQIMSFRLNWMGWSTENDGI